MQARLSAPAVLPRTCMCSGVARSSEGEMLLAMLALAKFLYHADSKVSGWGCLETSHFMMLMTMACALHVSGAMQGGTEKAVSGWPCVLQSRGVSEASGA